jgi:hypothetical protein
VHEVSAICIWRGNVTRSQAFGAPKEPASIIRNADWNNCLNLVELQVDYEEAGAFVCSNLLALSPRPHNISSSLDFAGLKNQCSRLRLMLAVRHLIRDSDSDAINGRCHTHTAAPVVGFVVINSRQ